MISRVISLPPPSAQCPITLFPIDDGGIPEVQNAKIMGATSAWDMRTRVIPPAVRLKDRE